MYERWVQQLHRPARDRGLACYSELVEEGIGPGITPDSDYSDIEVVAFPEVRNKTAKLRPSLSPAAVLPLCVPLRLTVLPHHHDIACRRGRRGTENLVHLVSDAFPRYA